MRLASGLKEGRNWVLARAALERAREIDPENAHVMNDLAWMLATCPDHGHRNGSRAVELALVAVRLQPENAAYRNTLGVAQFRTSQWQAAIDTLTKAEELHPGVYFAHNVLFIAMSHWQLGDREAARQWYEKAVAWLDEHPDSEFDEELRRFCIEAKELIEFDENED
jgi:Flp pilus assembly protein TadD